MSAVSEVEVPGGRVDRMSMCSRELADIVHCSGISGPVASSFISSNLQVFNRDKLMTNSPEAPCAKKVGNDVLTYIVTTLLNS